MTGPEIRYADPKPGEWKLAALARELCSWRGNEWDEYPMLCMVVEDGEGHLALFHMPIPDELWEITHPVNLLRSLAGQDVLSAFTPETTRRWRGYAFLTEAWTFVHGPAMECAPGECEHEAWVNAGKLIADHPDALEQRGVYAGTEDGRMVVASQLRGGEVKVSQLEQRGAGTDLSGRIPKVLWELVDNTTRYRDRRKARAAAPRN